MQNSDVNRKNEIKTEDMAEKENLPPALKQIPSHYDTDVSTDDTTNI